MTKMKKVLTIGGATLDTIIKYECMETMQIHKSHALLSYALLEEGAKIEVTDQTRFSGGGATNAAVSFKRQGYDVSFFGKVGDDQSGKDILAELKEYGIDVSNATVSKAHGTANSFVIPSLKGDRMVFAYRGANTNVLENELPKEAIQSCDFVYVTSLSKASAARLPEIVEIAKTHQVKVAINPGISQLVVGSGFVRDALHGIDILILNYDEAKQLMASLVSVDEGIRNAVESASHEHGEALLDNRVDFEEMGFSLRYFIREVLKMGPEIVVVTDGGEGLYVGTNDALYFHEALKVPVVNTLGAGDSFGSSFVGSIYAGKSIEASICYGLVNSASVIAHPDAKTGLMDKVALELAVEEVPKGLCRKTHW
jgi:sugar/nucleoside kinase (ribokinase family)